MKGEYCSVQIYLPANLTRAFGAMPDPFGISGGKPQPFAITWDICVPNSCSSNDIKNLLQQGADSVSPYIGQGKFNIDAVCSKDKKEDWKEDPVTVFATCLMTFFTIVILFCTIVDGFGMMEDGTKNNENKNSKTQPVLLRNVVEFGSQQSINKSELYLDQGSNVVMTNHLKPRQSIAGLVVNEEIPNGVLGMSTNKLTTNKNDKRKQVIQAFSLYTNVPKLLNTNQGSGALGCLNGIRVLSMCWVILGHTYSIMMPRPPFSIISNGLEMFKKLNQFLFLGIMNGTYSVDSFFLLSGLLVTYLYLKQLKKENGLKLPQIALFYFHRVWRLTPLYAIVLLCNTAYVKYAISGPLTLVTSVSDFGVDSDNCRKYWWRNLLYINNMFDARELCMGVTWYLANDMQMFLVSPLVILPLYYFPVVGMLLAIGLIATHITTTAVINLDSKNPAFNFEDVYIKPWCRIGVFAIGIILAFILHKTKCKIEFFKNKGLRMVTILALWILGIGLCCVIVYVTWNNGRDGNEIWGRDQILAYTSLERISWGIGLALIIMLCCTGHGGVINQILSWSAWVPLGRLTYGAFLIHITLMPIYLYNRNNMIYYSDYTTVYFFLGHLMLSYGAAFIFSVAFESPMMALEKIILPRKK